MQLGQAPCVFHGEIAAYLQPKEHLHSFEYEHLLLMGAKDLTYRKSANVLNVALRKYDAGRIRPSTLEEHIERTGKSISRIIEKKTTEILENTPGMSVSGIPEAPEALPPAIRTPYIPEEEGKEDRAKVYEEVISNYNAGKEKCDQIKESKMINDTELCPDNCVYVSIDDVGVDQQKNTRKNGGTKDGKVIENTVIHIQSREGKYVITAIGMKKAFAILIAFLLSNHLLENRHLYVFSDGARNIRSNLDIFFKPLCPFVHMLDWYHLEKRMTELLSMALKGGKQERRVIRAVLDGKLWAGNIADAITYLRGLNPKYIKNQGKLEEAVGYLEGKREYIGCYALRKELGLRNSSNPAEKANDIVVANRQKHNGMSWSSDGSGALAAITALFQNGEVDTWIRKNTIPFTMLKDKMAG